MRAVVVAALLVACGAQLGGGGGGSDNPADALVDTPPIDAGIDARACAGGDAHTVAPDGECLVMFTTPTTYVAAKAACAAMNAHLAYLKDATLDSVAETFVGSANTFIGLTDRTVEGTFVWDDGTPLTYTNWHLGEPNSGNGGGYQEDCAIVAGARVGAQWDDRPCDASEVANSGTFAYLCQY